MSTSLPFCALENSFERELSISEYALVSRTLLRRRFGFDVTQPPTAAFLVARLSSDGTHWENAGTGLGGAGTIARTLAVFGDKLIVGGDFSCKRF